jgi:hypothetical protein
MIKQIGIGLVVAMMATAASARSTTSDSCPTQPVFNFFGLFGGGAKCGGSSPVSAPEIDPSSALAGLTLLGAGLTVLRGRRSSK